MEEVKNGEQKKAEQVISNEEQRESEPETYHEEREEEWLSIGKVRDEISREEKGTG